jgi:pimeloyl-ACP methyl ester carboxylesterase
MQDVCRPVLRSLLASLPLAILAPTPEAVASCLPPPARACSAQPVVLEAEPMRVETRDGKTLHGDFYALPRKKGSQERLPAALLVHGHGGNRVAFETLADALARSGMAVLAIDLRGHGQSVTADSDWSKLDAAGQANLWTFAVRDLEAAVGWLRARPEVLSTGLNLFGYGGGAGLAAHFALSDESVRSLTLIEPFAGATFEEQPFDLAADLAELQGLPMKLVAEHSSGEAVEALITGLDASEWIQVELAKPVEGGLLSDKRHTKNWARWALEQNTQRGGDALGVGARG